MGVGLILARSLTMSHSLSLAEAIRPSMLLETSRQMTTSIGAAAPPASAANTCRAARAESQQAEGLRKLSPREGLGHGFGPFIDMGRGMWVAFVHSDEIDPQTACRIVYSLLRSVAKQHCHLNGVVGQSDVTGS